MTRTGEAGGAGGRRCGGRRTGRGGGTPDSKIPHAGATSSTFPSPPSMPQPTAPHLPTRLPRATTLAMRSSLPRHLERERDSRQHRQATASLGESGDLGLLGHGEWSWAASTDSQRGVPPTRTRGLPALDRPRPRPCALYGACSERAGRQPNRPQSARPGSIATDHVPERGQVERVFDHAPRAPCGTHAGAKPRHRRTLYSTECGGPRSRARPPRRERVAAARGGKVRKQRILTIGDTRARPANTRRAATSSR